jgi:hypothetical protein
MTTAIDNPVKIVTTVIDSWCAEVIADNSGEWSRNPLRFATEQEAIDYATDLSWRWTSVRKYRATPTTDAVSHRYTNGRLEEIVCGDK